MILKNKRYVFRDDLEIIPHVVDGSILRYFLMNPDNENIYEIGEREYLICSHLDGKFTLDTIRDKLECELKISLSLEYLTAFVEKLRYLDLLANERPKVWELRTPNPRPIYLLNIDPLMKWCAELLTTCFNRYFWAVIVTLLCAAIFLIIIKTGDLWYEIQMLKQVYGPQLFLLVPLLGFLIVLPLGEMAKALSCRYHGGHVSALILQFHCHIVPVVTVDILDSIWFFSKSKRNYVILSGIAGQTVLFVLCVLGWLNTELWSLEHHLFTLLAIATLLFTFFNAFPYVQRDGYLFLTSYLDIDNLAERSRRFFLSKLFLQPPSEPLSRNDAVRFFWFGLLSTFFKTVLVTLFLWLIGYSLVELFGGAGIGLFLVILILRFEYPVKRQWIKVPFMRRMLTCQSGAIRMRLIVKILFAVAFVAILLVPYRFEVGGEFSVVPVRQQGIRAEVAGTIEEVYVSENQMVTKGQAVARLDDQVYRNTIDIVQANILEVNALIELRVSGAKPEEIAAAEQQVEVAKKSLEYSAKEESRYLKMVSEKAIPETEYQLVKYKRDLDREALKSAEKNLEVVRSGARNEEIQAMEARRKRLEVELVQARADLEHTTLYSPIDGVIITRDLLQRLGQRLEHGDLFAVVEGGGPLLAEIQVSENDIDEILQGAQVKLRTWATPLTTMNGKIVGIAPVAHEKNRQGITRTLSEREKLIGQRELLRKEGRVVRVLAEFDTNVDGIKSDMTGYAKIQCGSRPVGIAFTQWLMRLIFVEVWSWIP